MVPPFSDAEAVIHSHSKASVMASLLFSNSREFRISHMEMIKGIRKDTTGMITVTLLSSLVSRYLCMIGRRYPTKQFRHQPWPFLQCSVQIHEHSLKHLLNKNFDNSSTMMMVNMGKY